MNGQLTVSAGNLERDRMTLEILDDEIKLLDDDIRLLEQDAEALRRRRQQFGEWRQKLLFSTELSGIAPSRGRQGHSRQAAPVKEASHAIP